MVAFGSLASSRSARKASSGLWASSEGEQSSRVNQRLAHVGQPVLLARRKDSAKILLTHTPSETARPPSSRGEQARVTVPGLTSCETVPQTAAT